MTQLTLVQLLVILLPLSVAAFERPVAYGEFHAVTNSDELVTALRSHQAIYLQPGRYELDNPLVVDRTRPLFLHGGNRRSTILVPRNPALPLLIVRRAPLVNLSNLRLAPAGGGEETDPIALVVESQDELIVELQECTIDDGAVHLRGPGFFHLQATSFFPHGRVREPLVVDHPDARAVMVGGNISNDNQPPRFDEDEAYHIRQRRGRLRVYGTGVQATLGRADIRIDSASPHGPHLISNVRSEGNNGARKGAFPSVLLLVPPSREKVDVLVEASSGSWGSQGAGKGRLADYSAAGTLWLVGNNLATGASRLVVGDTRRARIFALGNVFYGHADPLPKLAALSLDIGNLGYVGRAMSHPLRSLRLRTATPAAREAAPAVKDLPVVPFPEALRRPVLESVLPGMRSVAAYGARGDGVHDDSEAIQKALDDGCGDRKGKVLFFPEGTYRVTRRLLFNHREAGCTEHPSGGWLAGAGSGRSVIRRTTAGGVFASQGIAQTTIQGLTFIAKPFGTENDVMEPAFALENDPEVGHASQGVSFTDVVFDGGRQGLGIGLESATNCSENMLVDSTFRNAHVGMAIGSYNALANLVFRGSFESNDVAMGHDGEALTGGTWAVWGARIRGTRDHDLSLLNSAGGVWLFADVESDSRSLLSAGATSAIFPILIQGSRWRGSRPVQLDFSAGGGPIFVRSEVAQLALRLRAPFADNVALRIGGEIGGWQPQANEHSLVWAAPEAIE